MVDQLTRFTIACPLRSMSAEETAQKFVRNVIYRYGLVDAILTDRGSNFISDLFKNVYKLLGIKQLLSSGYHPQTSGVVERQNKTIAQLLRAALANENLSTWDQVVEPLVFLFNTTKHRSTGFTSYFLLFGREANVNFHAFERNRPFYGDTIPFNEYLPRILSIAHRATREAILKSQTKQNQYRAAKETPVHFNPGDFVLVRRTSFPKGQPQKLFSKFVGPFKVLKFIPPGNLTIESQKGLPLRLHADRVILYKPPVRPNADNNVQKLIPKKEETSKIAPPPVNTEEPIIWNDDDFIQLPANNPNNQPVHPNVSPVSVNNTPVRRSNRLLGRPVRNLPNVMQRPLEWAHRVVNRLSPLSAQHSPANTPEHSPNLSNFSTPLSGNGVDEVDAVL